MGGIISRYVDELRPDDFRGLRTLARLGNRRQVAAALGISERAVQRYDRDGAPRWIMQHLELYARGQVLVPQHWHGWWFNGEWLVSPEGLSQTPAQLLAGWWERQELAARRRKDAGPAQFVLL